jgi:hypothetical protein
MAADQIGGMTGSSRRREGGREAPDIGHENRSKIILLTRLNGRRPRPLRAFCARSGGGALTASKHQKKPRQRADRHPAAAAAGPLAPS